MKKIIQVNNFEGTKRLSNSRNCYRAPSKTQQIYKGPAVCEERGGPYSKKAETSPNWHEKLPVLAQANHSKLDEITHLYAN